MTPLQAIAVVGAGGAAGAVTRYATDLALPTAAGRFPWATFLVNMVGALLIGIVVARLTHRDLMGRAVPPWVRPLVVTGFLGGLTTFSTWMVETVQLWQFGEPRATILALGYLFGSVVLGVIAVRLGLRLGEPPPVVDTSTQAEADIG